MTLPPRLAGTFLDFQDLRLHYVGAEVIRWVDHEWPGWVELCLAESDGTLVSIVEKVPVIDQGDRLVPGAKTPGEC